MLNAIFRYCEECEECVYVSFSGFTKTMDCGCKAEEEMPLP